MQRPAAPDAVAEALLAWAREPALRGVALLDRPVRFDLLARLALGKPVALARPDLQAAAQRGSLRRAALLFIARTQFPLDADHYKLLGVAPNAPAESIREHHRLLMQIVHPDRAARDVRFPEGLAARINRAYGTLKDPQSRAAYDREHRVAGPHASGAPFATSTRPTTALVRRPLPPHLRQPLPEWLTAGFGGFVRRNPATVIFAALVSACSVAIATVAIVDQGAGLQRERNRESANASAPAPSAIRAFAPRPPPAGIAAVTAPPAVSTSLPLQSIVGVQPPAAVAAHVAVPSPAVPTRAQQRAVPTATQ